MLATSHSARIAPSRRLPGIRRLSGLTRSAAALAAAAHLASAPLATALVAVVLLASTALATPAATPSARATVQVTARVIRHGGGHEILATASEFIDAYTTWRRSAAKDGTGAFDALERLLDGGLVRVSVRSPRPVAGGEAAASASGVAPRILVEYVGS